MEKDHAKWQEVPGRGNGKNKYIEEGKKIDVV